MNLRMMQSLKRQVLSFRPSKADVPIMLQGLLIAAAFGRLFYGNYFASLVLTPIAIPWTLYRRKIIRERNNVLLGIQFKDALMSALTALKAGYSSENALVMATDDMKILYGARSPIYKEFSKIAPALKSNISIEKIFMEMGTRTGNPDIEEFASVFGVAKRSGGNMVSIMQKSVDVIGRRCDVAREIDVLISAKRMEARIMDVVPFFIIQYVGISGDGYFDPLYGNAFGVVVMTICLIAYIGAFLLSEKITNIRI